jgi:hypothetical protein
MSNASVKDQPLSDQVDLEKARDSPTRLSDSNAEPPFAIGDEEKKPVQPHFADPAAFPEGGKQAWLTVAGSFAALFVSFGWVNCVGIFQDYYATNQLKAYSTSTISWISTLQGLGSLYLSYVVSLLTTLSFLHASHRRHHWKDI